MKRGEIVMTLQQQAYGLINRLSDESVYALIQVMMRMLPHEHGKTGYEFFGDFDIPNRETAQAIRDGRAGIGLRSFKDAASMFAALDSEPDEEE